MDIENHKSIIPLNDRVRAFHKLMADYERELDLFDLERRAAVESKDPAQVEIVDEVTDALEDDYQFTNRTHLEQLLRDRLREGLYPILLKHHYLSDEPEEGDVVSLPERRNQQVLESLVRDYAVIVARLKIMELKIQGKHV